MIKPLEIVLSSTLSLNCWSIPQEHIAPQLPIDNDYSLEAHLFLKDKYPKTEEERLLDIINQIFLNEKAD